MEIFVPDYPPKQVIINHVIPALIVLVVATTAIFNVPSSVVTYRAIKFFKRLKATPVSPLATLAGLGLANFMTSILGILLLGLAGWLVYDAQFAGSVLVFLPAFTLVFFSLVAVFLIIASICRTARVASAVSNIAFIPIMFFSGVFVPLNMLPDWIVRNVSPFMPTTHAVELLQGLWLGNSLFDFTQEVIVLFVFLILGLIISAKTFRWE